MEVSEHCKKKKYPESARRAQIQGQVIVQFTVDKEGYLRDFMVLRGIGGGCEEEVIRVITEHARFKPGISQGRAVPVRMSLPIIFRLPGRRGAILLRQ